MTDFDPYNQKVADVCALIREHGKCEEWELLKNSERGLEVLCAIVDAVRAENGWQPIETAPKSRMNMYVVIAFDVDLRHGKYTSDPYCTWPEKDGTYARWPHPFKPTHWMPLPGRPTAVAGQTKQQEG